mmetsp:Transcript_2038/g.2969  ORF Transcript_2038/g.2969 Transcript_2038/m.2969 type:complete len:147 (+) Transcript_2038:106-546(+)
MVVKVSTEIEIDAPAEEVFQTLIQFDKWKEWNTFIVDVTGAKTPVVGEQITIHFKDKFALKSASPIILKVDPEGKELRWLGRGGCCGMIMDGAHHFECQDIGDGKTRLLHGEDFTGALPVLMPSIMKQTREAFEELNTALKLKCET